MALVIGTDSWVTVAEADTYLENRIYASDWFTLDTSPASPGVVAKESLLITAYRWLLNHPELELEADSTDSNVKNAQIEAAIYLQNHFTEIDGREAAIATGVVSMRMSRRYEDLERGASSLPASLVGMLRSFLRVTGGSFVELGGHYDV